MIFFARHYLHRKGVPTISIKTNTQRRRILLQSVCVCVFFPPSSSSKKVNVYLSHVYIEVYVCLCAPPPLQSIKKYIFFLSSPLLPLSTSLQFAECVFFLFHPNERSILIFVTLLTVVFVLSFSFPFISAAGGVAAISTDCLAFFCVCFCSSFRYASMTMKLFDKTEKCQKERKQHIYPRVRECRTENKLSCSPCGSTPIFIFQKLRRNPSVYTTNYYS